MSVVDDWSNGRRLGKIALGDVTERPKVLASKARVGKPTGGSNPSITAKLVLLEPSVEIPGFVHVLGPPVVGCSLDATNGWLEVCAIRAISRWLLACLSHLGQML